jgi:hypothetical protein
MDNTVEKQYDRNHSKDGVIIIGNAISLSLYFLIVILASWPEILYSAKEGCGTFLYILRLATRTPVDSRSSSLLH